MKLDKTFLKKIYLIRWSNWIQTEKFFFIASGKFFVDVMEVAEKNKNVRKCGKLGHCQK
jgi:hypothetical protein